MKLLHKLRNGAYFVDIMLIIAAVVAIIGLATFVHLRGAKSPFQASKQSGIAFNADHLDTLALDNGGAAAQASGSSTTPTPKTTGDDETYPSLQAAVGAPEAEGSDGAHCGTSCNITEPIQTPPITPPIIPITVQPVAIPRITKKPCNGLLQQHINSGIDGIPDHIECPLNVN
jgi:hypothetical protein